MFNGDRELHRPFYRQVSTFQSGNRSKLSDENRQCVMEAQHLTIKISRRYLFKFI